MLLAALKRIERGIGLAVMRGRRHQDDPDVQEQDRGVIDQADNRGVIDHTKYAAGSCRWIRILLTVGCFLTLYNIIKILVELGVCTCNDDAREVEVFGADNIDDIPPIVLSLVQCVRSVSGDAYQAFNDYARDF